MVVTDRSASVMRPDASAVPQFVGREHARALACGAQVREVVFGAQEARVHVMWRSSRIVISAKQELPGRVQALLREEGITSRRHSCARGVSSGAGLLANLA